MAPPIVRGRELLPGLRQRAIGVGGAVAVRAFAGPFAWNAILRAVNAPQFFVDAALPVFPVSWQDTGFVFRVRHPGADSWCGAIVRSDGGS